MSKLKKRMSRKVILTIIMTMVFSFGIAGNAAVYAGNEAYLGEISMFAGNFAPKNWAYCNGQLLQIQQYTALFSILGTTYGGDGVTTFALPDLRGRSPIGAYQTGPASGLSPYDLGQTGGSETVTVNQMPTHSHTLTLNASTAAGTTNTPGNGTYLGKVVTPDRQEVNLYTTTNSPDTAIGIASTGVSGGSQQESNRDPYLAINYIICLQGIYPSRD